MVELEKIPEEQPRLDFKELPQEIELKATKEEERAGTAEKTGGLIITFLDKQGKEVKQKYSKVYGTMLKKYMKDLGLKDTKQLQEKYYKYRLTVGRTGYPRYMPIAKA